MKKGQTGTDLVPAHAAGAGLSPITELDPAPLPAGVERIVRPVDGYYREIVITSLGFRLLKRRDSRNYYCELALALPHDQQPRPVSTKTADLVEALGFGRKYTNDAKIKLVREEPLGEPQMKTLVEEFLRWQATKCKKPEYVHDRVKRHRAITKWHLLPMFGNRPLSSLTTKDAELFILKRQQQGAKQSTIMADVNTLRTWCKFAIEKKWRKDRLFVPIEQQKPDEYNNSWFDLDSFIMLRLILRQEDPGLYSLVMFCYHTGCRVTEASNMRFEDYVPLTVRRTALHRIRLQGKAKTRIIPVRGIVKTILDKMVVLNGRAEGLVFPNVKRHSESLHHLLVKWGLYYDADGNTRHLGAMRHTRATVEIVRERMARPMIAAWMGHTVNEQERTYSKVLNLLSQTDFYTRRAKKVDDPKGLKGIDEQRRMLLERAYSPSDNRASKKADGVKWKQAQ